MIKSNSFMHNDQKYVKEFSFNINVPNLLGFGTILGICNYIYILGTIKRKVPIKVLDKQCIIGILSDSYLVTVSNNEGKFQVFKTAKSLYGLQLNSYNKYATMKVGEIYEIDYYGITNSNIFTPNIIKIYGGDKNVDLVDFFFGHFYANKFIS